MKRTHEQQIWQKSRAELFRDLECGEEGLSAPEAARRLEQYGPNELGSEGQKSVLRIFLEQFKDLMVLILIIAAVISAFSGNGESIVCMPNRIVVEVVSDEESQLDTIAE